MTESLFGDMKQKIIKLTNIYVAKQHESKGKMVEAYF